MGCNNTVRCWLLVGWVFQCQYWPWSIGSNSHFMLIWYWRGVNAFLFIIVWKLMFVSLDFWYRVCRFVWVIFVSFIDYYFTHWLLVDNLVVFFDYFCVCGVFFGFEASILNWAQTRLIYSRLHCESEIFTFIKIMDDLRSIVFVLVIWIYDYHWVNCSVGLRVEARLVLHLVSVR